MICQNSDTCDVSYLKCKQKLRIYLNVINGVRRGSYVKYELEYVKLIALQSVATEERFVWIILNE